MIKDVNVTIAVERVIEKGSQYFPLIFSVGAAQEYTEMDLQTARENTSIKDMAELIINGDNPPEKIAIYGVETCTSTSDITNALKKVLDKNWRQLVISGETAVLTKEIMSGLMDYVETTTKIMFIPYHLFKPVSVSDPTKYERSIVVAGSTLDTEGGSYDKSEEIKNIMCILGAVGGLEAGSFSYKNMIVNGANVLSDEEFGKNIGNSAPFIMAILEKAGDEVISDGKAISGDYIDITDSTDYIVNEMEYQTQKLMNSQNKIPYTNNGIAMLESVAVNVLKTAYNNGMIADNEDGSPAYSVSFGLREDANAEDVKTRRYIEGNFNFVVAGAIHEVEINGTMKYV